MRAFLSGSSALAAFALLVHCSDEGALSPPVTGSDAGDSAPLFDTSTGKDAATADSEPPLAQQTEFEPNNGAIVDAGADAAPTLQVNSMNIPGAMSGAIDPADDIDIFSVAPKPGELWQWKVVPGPECAPSLTVFDTVKGNLNPTVAVRAEAKGTEVTIDHFILHGGTFVAGVRDARNLAPTSAHVGGPTLTYKLEARKITANPKLVTFPQKISGKLGRVSEIALFKFTGTKGTGFDVIVRAARLGAGSKLDSRLSLFDLTGNANVLTNDDAASTTDSEVGGNLPANADYLVILENEAQGTQPIGSVVPDLSYEIEFKLR